MVIIAAWTELARDEWPLSNSAPTAPWRGRHSRRAPGKHLGDFTTCEGSLAATLELRSVTLAHCNIVALPGPGEGQSREAVRTCEDWGRTSQPLPSFPLIPRANPSATLRPARVSASLSLPSLSLASPPLSLNPRVLITQLIPCGKPRPDHRKNDLNPPE